MIYFIVLAGMAKKVFKTAAFNHSAIPPLSILPDSFDLQTVLLSAFKEATAGHARGESQRGAH